MGVTWKKGRRVLENKVGNLLCMHSDPLQPGDGRRTYYKSKGFVRHRMAHRSGRVLGSMAGEEVAQRLSCKSLNAS